MHLLTARQALEALGLLVVAFGGGVTLARLLGAAGWERAGGYLGFLVIGTVLGYVIAVYALRWAPRAAWRRALLGAAGLVGAMMAADLIGSALR